MAKRETVSLTKADLAVLWDALLNLCGNEGCVVAEHLCRSCGSEHGMRIYEEVFSDENLTYPYPECIIDPPRRR